MHDSLETRMAAWRNEVLTAVSGRKAVVAELEDHLRLEIRRLTAEGLAPNDAFAEAVRRMGDPRQLAEQFACVAWWRHLPRSVALTYGLFAVLCLAAIVFSTADRRAGRMGGLFYGHALAANLGFMGLLTLGAVAMVTALKTWGNGFSLVERRVCRRSIFYLSAICAALVFAGLGLGILWAADHHDAPYYRSWLQVENAALCVLFALGSILLAQLRFVSPPLRWLLAFAGTFAMWAIGFRTDAAAAVPYAWMCLAVPAVHGAIALLRDDRRMVAIGS